MLADYVQETASNPGTSTTINLGGAATGRVGFVTAFGSGASCFYAMDDGSQAEWGIGTVTSGTPNTLARTTVIGNTAGTTARLNFTGTVRVYAGLPADLAVHAANSGVASGPAVLAWEQISGFPRTVTASSSEDITLPAGYEMFRLDWRGDVSAGGTALWLRMNLGAGVLSGGSDYEMLTSISVTSSVTIATATDSKILLTNSVAAGGPNRFTAEIFPGAASVDPTVMVEAMGRNSGTSTLDRTTVAGAVVGGTAARATALRVLPSGGTFTGRLMLYGARY